MRRCKILFNYPYNCFAHFLNMAQKLLSSSGGARPFSNTDNPFPHAAFPVKKLGTDFQRRMLLSDQVMPRLLVWDSFLR